MVFRAVYFISAQNAHWLKTALKYTYFHAKLSCQYMRFAPRWATQAALSLPIKFWKTSKPPFSRSTTMRTHPGERISVLPWYSGNLMISITKAYIQIRTENAYKKFQKYSNFHNFWNTSVFFVLFCFIYIQYGFIAHLNFQKHCSRL